MTTSIKTATDKETTARNLTQAFEALCATDDAEASHQLRGSTQAHAASSTMQLSKRCTTSEKSKKPALISPTSVTDAFRSSSSLAAAPLTTTLCASSSMSHETDVRLQAIPHSKQGDYQLKLHSDLQRDLSQACVQRIAFYSVIHDVNKEASALMAVDTIRLYGNMQQQALTQDQHVLEEHSPLVQAAMGVTGASASYNATHLKLNESCVNNTYQPFQVAIVDEEEWLLATISTRDPAERRACPDTFSQAMGELEYESLSPSGISNHARTQLWKPSRSWWEAKSGKNPWIEPISHNKRWRYLWPLIHYHKFLAKCIKKLKRNGVDVKHSVTPVSVFLREEVCAISDHLAALSLFGSDEWMACLQKFTGWCEIEAEHYYRGAIEQLKLRPVEEPGDIDSPLLRSQIDKHFLSSMANARAQMRENAPPTSHRGKIRPQGNGAPPVYPRYNPAIPKQGLQQPMPGSVDSRRQRGRHFANQQYAPPHHRPQWMTPQQAWEHSQQLNAAAGGYCDSSSDHSTLSVDSYQTMPMYHAGGPMPFHPGYHPYPYHAAPSSDASQASTVAFGYTDPSMCHPDMQYPHGQPQQWVDPNIAYHMQMQAHGQYFTPSPLVSPPKEDAASDELYMAPPAETTPEKATTDEDSNGLNTSMSQSPFWSHLHQAAMANLTTPVKASPMAPRRFGDDDDALLATFGNDDATDYSVNAQPLLLQNGHYYGNYFGTAVSAGY
ncbi:hypothetical protein MPSEU_000265000 [Mayamaea pseudoterrestris]|nr:hypothetical protein MPSEU_000265000 [Mayamaea pseudoterrestris]